MTEKEAIEILLDMANELQLYPESKQGQALKIALIKLLDNNNVLDKIRERIELEKLGYPPSAGYYKAIVKVLQIIDNYKAESEAGIGNDSR